MNWLCETIRDLENGRDCGLRTAIRRDRDGRR